MQQYTFNNLRELKEWLNRFDDDLELEAAAPANGSQYFQLTWVTMEFPDGSTVNDVWINTV